MLLEIMITYKLLDYLILNGEKMYTAKDIKKVLSLLEELVDADSIVAG